MIIQKMKKNIKRIILLNALRFCIQTTNFNDECLYSQILTENYKDYLKQNSIPGNGYSSNIYIDNFFSIEKYLNSHYSNYGVYVCSCGLYYTIPPCGFPTKTEEKNKCGNCGEYIGYAPKPVNMKGNHGMVIRDGHYRIFLNLKQKYQEFSKYGDNDINIPNMLLSDYKTKIIDPKMKEQELGINKPPKYLFKYNDIKIRKLSTIGYRLLNFILYSHLFFSNHLGKISDEELNNYLCDEMDCFQMIKMNWELLENALGKEYNIQTFMNIIFKKLTEQLKNSVNFKSNKEREEFEAQIEIIIKEAFKEYPRCEKEFKKFEKEKNLDKDDMEALLLEIHDPDLYDQSDYPFYKLFLMPEYSTKRIFFELQKIPDYEYKYPILTLLLNKNKKEVFLLEYLNDFNNFANNMIKDFSYQISR